MTPARIVTQSDIDAALLRIDKAGMHDEANLLKAWLMQLEAMAEGCEEGDEA